MSQMIDLFDIKLTDEEQKYFEEVHAPQYLPNIECPKLETLYDKKKYDELISSIGNSNVDDEIKEFLKLAATRHIVFNYSKIADYYAHAPKDVQKLFEESVLVIVDIDEAITNGYIRLSKELEGALKKQRNQLDENNNLYTQP